MATPKTSLDGVIRIKRFEGCKLTAYQDIVGVWTIGYGETGPYVVKGLTITKAQADEGLWRRLRDEFEPGVVDALKGTPVTQQQFDALVSLAWNIGVGREPHPGTARSTGSGLKGSTLMRKHREGDYVGAGDEFPKWNHAGGQVVPALTRRRAAERLLYLSNVPV